MSGVDSVGSPYRSLTYRGAAYGILTVLRRMLREQGSQTKQSISFSLNHRSSYCGMETFPTQEDCIAYLERLRWQGSPECPQCESTDVGCRTEHAIGRIGRFNCHECRSTFKATHGTLFQGTKIPLQKWFLALSLMANAKKRLSSCQLSRDLGVKQKTCWRIMMTIRAEMGKDNV